MAVSPAAALGSCASAAAGGHAFMTDHGDMTPSVMTSNGDNAIGAEISQFRNAMCIASCALAGMAFYAGPDEPIVKTPAIDLADYSVPTSDQGVSSPFHLDPPPPRI